MESLAVLCVRRWPVHVPSARNREKRLSVGVSVPNLCHLEIKPHNSNSIHHAHRVSQPLDLCFLVVSWFNLGSFLLLREFYKLQGKIYLFFSKSFVHQRLIGEVFTIPEAFATPDAQTA